MRRILISSTIVLMLLFGSSVHAAADFSMLKDIFDTAATVLPEQAEIVAIEEIENKIVVTYVDENKMTYYDLFFDTAERKLEKLHAQSSNIIGSTLMTKSESEIEEIVEAAYPKAVNVEITTEKEGVNSCYVVTFDNEDHTGRIKLNPVTGAIGEREYTYDKEQVSF